MNKSLKVLIALGAILVFAGISWISSQIGYKRGCTDVLEFVKIALNSNETHLQREMGQANALARAIEENDKSELKRMLYQQIGEIYDRSRQSSLSMQKHIDGRIQGYIALLDGYTPPETKSYDILDVEEEVKSAMNLLIAPHYKAQQTRSAEVIEMY